ncbi:MAG: TonB-dependent receptor [Desulfobacteraceae bacterium]|nr:TonB-dependent receptor [Desulfobacteraceae bacterium]
MTGERNFIIFALVIAGLIFNNSTWADCPQEVIKLQEIVVTAHVEDRKLVATPASISLITADEIQEMGAKTVAQIIENIPGVLHEDSTRDYITIRGNRSSQSSGVLVLINGVPANSGISGYTEYDAIPVSDIEIIEVLRSSGSIVYGPDAARGVINIITKKGKNKSPETRISTTYGSWNTWEGSAGISGGINNWNYALGASFLTTDGYVNDNKKRESVRADIGYCFSESTNINYNIAWHEVDYDTIYGRTKWQIDNFRNDSVFPTSATNDTLIHYRENSDESFSQSLKLSHSGENSFLTGFISYDDTDHVYDYLKNRLNPAYNKASSYYDYREDRDQKRLLARLFGGYYFDFDKIAYTPAFGVDFEKTNFDQKKSYPWSPTPNSASQLTAIAKGDLDTQKERFGFFTSNEFLFGEEWELNLDLRFDNVKYDVKSAQPKQVSNEDTDYSWKLTPAWHPCPDSTIYTSVSRSYWYPVLIYYNYAMQYGDAENRPEDLKPEEYLTFELGYKHYFNSKLSLALAGYYMETEDKYLSLYDVNTWKGYQNVGKAEHKGIEIEASGRISSYMGYRLLGAWQDVEWDDATFRAYVWGATPAADTRQNIDISGKKVPQIPEYTASFGLDFYFWDYFKLSNDVNYVGARHIDVLNRYKTDSYVTFDTMLSFTRNNYKFWILGRNLFNKESESMFNETGKRNADGTPAHLYYPTDGRYIEAGITISF